MDLRITNTCNNNCLYCLEQEYRAKEKYIPKEEIFLQLQKNTDTHITFYGGNPLLHPEIEEIISFCQQQNKYEGIGILSNTFGIRTEKITILKQLGLTNMGIYFHSFEKEIHNKIVNGGITLKELLENITDLQKQIIHVRIIIHVHKQNIATLFRDIWILSQHYDIKEIEYINYFPFDRPYEKYHEILAYQSENYRKEIDTLFKIIKTLKINAKFVKFPRVFFGDFLEFYDFENGILRQISAEDTLRIASKEAPFCFVQKRCEECFLQDNCTWYEQFKIHHLTKTILKG